jgi:calcium permeable stress-gated cation channel
MFNVHFVFTLLSAAVTTSYKLFINPVEWVQAISQSFPSGGSFFINYLILNLIVFPIELLRPGPVLYYLALRWYYTTPREFQKLSESASILNYGFLYPMNCLLFIVVLCYSIISPIVVLPGVIYFGTAWIVYKNQLMYVYVKKSEGKGRLWKMAYHRTIAGLFIFQFLIAGLLSTKLGII